MNNIDNITIIYDIVLILLSCFVLIFLIILYNSCKKNPIKAKETLPSTKLPASSYKLIDIDVATDGFNLKRIIGKGRLGTVYVAVMPTKDVVGFNKSFLTQMHGEKNKENVVAVKRVHSSLVLNNHDAGFSFSSTLKWLSSAYHPHVVPILGFCEAPGERIVVMEHNGMVSLDLYLHGGVPGSNSGKVAVLDWEQRLKVAAGVARGIEYLHDVMVPNIIHGCVKPSNILIDTNFCGKICDYGLQFLAPFQKELSLVGYVDNEYWVGEKRGPSKESDVYGFGVVLLELLSGRTSELLGLNIVVWGIPLIKERKFSELLDPRLKVPSNVEPLVRLAKLALACVGNSRNNRPLIGQVVTILNNLEMGPWF